MASLSRKLRLLEDDYEETQSRLRTTTEKLTELGKVADESERSVEILSFHKVLERNRLQNKKFARISNLLFSVNFCLCNSLQHLSQRLSLCFDVSIFALMLFFGFFCCSIWTSILFHITCLCQCLYFVVVIFISHTINNALEAYQRPIFIFFWSVKFSFVLPSVVVCRIFEDPIFWSTDYQMIITFMSNYLSLLCIYRVLFNFNKCMWCPFLTIY